MMSIYARSTTTHGLVLVQMVSRLLLPLTGILEVIVIALLVLRNHDLD